MYFCVTPEERWPEAAQSDQSETTLTPGTPKSHDTISVAPSSKDTECTIALSRSSLRAKAAGTSPAPTASTFGAPKRYDHLAPRKCVPCAAWSFLQGRNDSSNKAADYTSHCSNARSATGVLGAGLPPPNAARGTRRLVLGKPLPTKGMSPLCANWAPYMAWRQGVPKSHKEEAAWFRKAGDQRVVSAQNSLGAMYSEGQRLPQSCKEAVVWYRKAANKGHAGAQFDLGRMYYGGLGLPQS